MLKVYSNIPAQLSFFSKWTLLRCGLHATIGFVIFASNQLQSFFNVLLSNLLSSPPPTYTYFCLTFQSVTLSPLLQPIKMVLNVTSAFCSIN